MVLTKTAMKELMTHMSFTQLRFHCSKQRGRTFHVTTAANRSGEAVVQYFSAQTDVQPASCGSFVRMRNDNSNAAGVCKMWGWESGKIGLVNGGIPGMRRGCTSTPLVWYIQITGGLLPLV